MERVSTIRLLWRFTRRYHACVTSLRSLRRLASRSLFTLPAPRLCLVRPKNDGVANVDGVMLPAIIVLGWRRRTFPLTHCVNVLACEPLGCGRSGGSRFVECRLSRRCSKRGEGMLVIHLGQYPPIGCQQAGKPPRNCNLGMLAASPGQLAEDDPA